MQHWTRRTAALAAIALTAAAGIAADDERTATVAIERAEVTVSGSSVVVEGETSHTGGVVVADDTGDAQFPGFGLDIESASIEQVDGDLLEFRLTVADLQADVLAAARMEWPVVSIDGAEVELWAWRTYANALTSDPSPDWTFTVASISDAGFLESPADGELDGSTFVWRVAASTFGAREGAWLSGSDEFGDPLLVNPVASSCGAAGLLSCGSSFDTLAQDVPFVVGGSARLELRDAKGRLVGEAPGKVRRGTFTASIGDVAKGTYELTIIAEYADVATEKVVKVVVR